MENSKKNNIMVVVLTFIMSFVVYLAATLVVRGTFISIQNLGDLPMEEANMILGKNPVYLGVNSIVDILVIVCLMFIVKKKNEKVFEYDDVVKFRKRSFNLYSLGILLATINMVVFTLFAVCSGLFSYGSETVSDFSTSVVVEFVICGLVYSFITGYCEELLHRGIIYKQLNKACPKYSLYICSFLFMMTELSGSQFKLIDYVGVFLAGVFFCYLYDVSSSMFLSAGFHSGVHFLLLMVTKFQGVDIYQGPMFMIFNPSNDFVVGGISLGSPYGIVTAVINMLGIVILTIYKKKKNIKSEAELNMKAA